MPEFIIYSNADDTLGVVSPAHVPSVPSGRPYVIVTDPVFPDVDRSLWRINPAQLVNGAGPATITSVAKVPTKADVIAERERRVLAGTTINVTGYGNVQLSGTDRTRLDLQALLSEAQMRIAAGDTTSTSDVTGVDGVVHALTPAQIVDLWMKGAAWIKAHHTAATTIEALDPIPSDYATRSEWP